MKFRILSLFAIALVSILTIQGCSGSSSKPEGKLKNTQYCERYKKFEEEVAVAEPKRQIELLENVIEAKDFPSEPATLKRDYQDFLAGLKTFVDGTYDSEDEDKYKKISERIQRHAIENCSTLESNAEQLE